MGRLRPVPTQTACSIADGNHASLCCDPAVGRRQARLFLETLEAFVALAGSGGGGGGGGGGGAQTQPRGAAGRGLGRFLSPRA